MKYSEVEIKEWVQNRKMTVKEVSDRLPPNLKKLSYVVGRWIWLEFKDRLPTREERETLKRLGFQWNKKRKVWQHPCGVFTPGSKTDPRYKYPVHKLEEVV